MSAVVEQTTPEATASDIGKSNKVETPFQRFLAGFFASKVAIGAFIVLVILILIALFASLISPTDPYDLAKVSVLDSKLPPGAESMDGVKFLLGTDGAGRVRREDLRGERREARRPQPVGLRPRLRPQGPR